MSNVQEEPKAPDCFKSSTVKKKTGCGSLFVTIGESDDGKVIYIAARLGKGGGCANAMCTVVGELAAEALRAGTDPETIVKTLLGVCCSSRTQDLLSCADAIGHALAEYYVEKIKKNPEAKL